MPFYFFFIVSLIVGAIHLYRDRRPRYGRRVAEVFLLWLLVIDVGIGGFFGFVGHTVFADQAAASIGWPAGNPFQTEVAVANLAIGTLGILCYWLRSEFWTATVIATSVWLLGDAMGHVQQIIVAHNYHPNNAGAALYNDIVVPLILIVLLLYQRYAGGGEREAAHTQ
ncbi:MAG: hypothetical protein JOZ19_13435 [Rubrobacter sp.]|nr:hypothetical protein [Rubrobacter sp.]